MSKNRKHKNFKQGGNTASAVYQNKSIEESPQEERKMCQCGCGQKVKNRFISGHNLKEIIALRKIPYEIRKCNCGCEQNYECQLNSGRRFIHGHNSRGKNNPFYGKRHSKNTKELMSDRKMENPPNYWLGKKRSIRDRKKMSEAQIRLYENGYINPATGKSYPSNKKGKTLEEFYGVERAKEIVKKMLNIRSPNNAENKLNEFLQETLPNEYKYVGTGEFILGGRCPDFLNINGKKKLIELFGIRWHKKEEEIERKEYFKRYGFDTLIIWEPELKDKEKLKEKIMEFANV